MTQATAATQAPAAQAAQPSDWGYVPGAGYRLPVYPFREPPELTHPDAPRAPYPVVIVGGGLTGLTMACSLAQLGIAAVLIDEDQSVGVRGASSRGICYTQKSLEVFDRLGLYPRIAQRGIQWRVGRTYAGHDEVYSFDLGAQSAFSLSCQPPFINLQQFYIEAYLVDRVSELGHVDLRWLSRLVGFSQTTDHATLQVSTPSGDYELKARWVVDASGAHSPIRRHLQVPVAARRGDDRWCIADVRFLKEPPRERHTWIEAPFNDNRAVWQHLMADGVWRIDYQMAPDSDPAVVSREDVVRERLARHFGADVEVELVWVGPYAYRSECVERMREGRVFFVGDAAKVVSPFGARGGNTGISDADNLAWKLAAVMEGRAHESLLATYHDERHEAATENVRVTQRTARFLRPADGMERRFRRAALALARRYPFARALVNTGRMAVANRYSRSPACGKGGGQSVQNVRIGDAASSPSLNDVLTWAQGRPLLVAFGRLRAGERRALQALCATGLVRGMQVVERQDDAQVRECLPDPRQRLRTACQPDNPGCAIRWALIRPDAYVASTGERWDASAVKALGDCLGISSLLGDAP